MSSANISVMHSQLSGKSLINVDDIQCGTEHTSLGDSAGHTAPLRCNVMRVRVRPGLLTSFGLRVSSDCDAGSLARGVRRYCCRLVFL